MSVLSWFYQLLFAPLELLFEAIYGMAYIVVKLNAGLAIIPLSLCINLLSLPFYNRADAIQQQERDRQKQMAPSVDHIKRVFKGDERYMMLQTYYRTVQYKPIYSLRSTLPLLLEIPFFVAAYHFLSNLPILNGATLGPLVNLAQPDGLLKIGGASINLLPILMTAINLLSSSIYTRDMSRRDKVQLYGIALVFLVLLYQSPSGLVFYWTLNNLFSLFKNLINSMKNRKLAIRAISTLAGLALLFFVLLVYRKNNFYRLAMFAMGIGFLLPLALGFRKKREAPKAAASGTAGEGRIFALGCLFMALLTGALIPSSVIKASPAEFVVVSEYQSPLLYVFSALALGAGAFLVWFGLFHYLAGPKARRAMAAGMWVLCVWAIVNYMFFGTNLGNLSADLRYDLELPFIKRDYIFNAAVLLPVGIAAALLCLKKQGIVKAALPILVLAVAGMSAWNIVGIGSELPRIKALAAQESGLPGQAKEEVSFKLSKGGKNVIVLMLDRGVDCFVPYMMAEDPGLERQFDGFTWYPNALSYSNNTNTGAPALFGGYEYVPEAVNARPEVSLAEKHSEALRLMPALFNDAGYEVTVLDPPYAGYSHIPDLSIYDEYEHVNAWITQRGRFNRMASSFSTRQQVWKRNLFCFSIMKVSPLVAQKALYQSGTYFNASTMDVVLYQIQQQISTDEALGIDEAFLNAYSALCALPEMTQISDGDENTLLVMDNDTAHDAILLQEPEYEPALRVDNREYEAAHADRFNIGDRPMRVRGSSQKRHYQCNMAAMKKIGAWLDHLRDEGVYDNTRIIIVADHGRSLGCFPDLLFKTGQVTKKTRYNPEDVLCYNPLLMVKDFGETGFKTDRQFMTNADTPLLATKSLIDNPQNPFTGKPLSDAMKRGDEQHVLYSDYWNVNSNNGNVFLPGYWYRLRGHDIFDTASWEGMGEK